MRTAFFGTPAIAVPALRALTRVSEVVGVVCQPDRPAGRGLELSAPAVKLAAAELGLEAHQPTKVRTGNLHEWLGQRAVEAVVVMAYGRILPPDVLAAPRLGCINLHASLLPRYRGAAPITWAIIRGEAETGMSIMQMDAGLDTGAVFTERRLAIDAHEDAGSVTERMAALGATMVELDLPAILRGELVATPQDPSLATLAPPLDRGTAQIDWTASAATVKNLVRGLSPRPGAETTVRGRGVKILSVATEPEGPPGAPGHVVVADRTGLCVATGQGSVWIQSARPEGRREQTARDLVNGRVFSVGDALGTRAAP